MTRSALPAGKFLVRLFTVLIFSSALLTLGCKKKDVNAGTADAGFKMGDPITDTSIAAIVQSEGGAADTLTAAEFRSRFEMVRQRFPMIDGNNDQAQEIRRRLVEDFVLRHAFAQEIKKSGLQPDSIRVQAQMNQIRGQFPSQQEYQAALAAEGLTEDSLHASIVEGIQIQMLQQKWADASAQPTPAELEAFRKERAEQIRASHILFELEPGAPTAKTDSIQKKASAVLDSVKKGTDFADLARRHSQDASGQQGGDLDFFSRGMMVPPFEKAAFALTDSGDVTQDLVRTRYGYHIIKLTGKRTAALMDTAQARQIMYSERQRKAVETAVENIKKTVTVRVNEKVIQTDINKKLETYD